MARREKANEKTVRGSAVIFWLKSAESPFSRVRIVSLADIKSDSVLAEGSCGTARSWDGEEHPCLVLSVEMETTVGDLTLRKIINDPTGEQSLDSDGRQKALKMGLMKQVNGNLALVSGMSPVPDELVITFPEGPDGDVSPRSSRTTGSGPGMDVAQEEGNDGGNADVNAQRMEQMSLAGLDLSDSSSDEDEEEDDDESVSEQAVSVAHSTASGGTPPVLPDTSLKALAKIVPYNYQNPPGYLRPVTPDFSASDPESEYSDDDQEGLPPRKPLHEYIRRSRLPTPPHGRSAMEVYRERLEQLQQVQREMRATHAASLSVQKGAKEKATSAKTNGSRRKKSPKNQRSGQKIEKVAKISELPPVAEDTAAKVVPPPPPTQQRAVPPPPPPPRSPIPLSPKLSKAVPVALVPATNPQETSAPLQASLELGTSGITSQHPPVTSPPHISHIPLPVDEPAEQPAKPSKSPEKVPIAPVVSQSVTPPTHPALVLVKEVPAMNVRTAPVACPIVPSGPTVAADGLAEVNAGASTSGTTPVTKPVRPKRFKRLPETIPCSRISRNPPRAAKDKVLSYTTTKRRPTDVRAASQVVDLTPKAIEWAPTGQDEEEEPLLKKAKGDDLSDADVEEKLSVMVKLEKIIMKLPVANAAIWKSLLHYSLSADPNDQMDFDPFKLPIGNAAVDYSDRVYQPRDISTVLSSNGKPGWDIAESIKLIALNSMAFNHCFSELFGMSTHLLQATRDYEKDCQKSIDDLSKMDKTELEGITSKAPKKTSTPFRLPEVQRPIVVQEDQRPPTKKRKRGTSIGINISPATARSEKLRTTVFNVASPHVRKRKSTL